MRECSKGLRWEAPEYGCSSVLAPLLATKTRDPTRAPDTDLAAATQQALGTPIGELLMRAGGPTRRPQAVLVGGYFGTWLPVDVAWQAQLSPPGLQSVHAAMGTGILVVLPESSCGLAETARVVRYLADQGAGQCGPCMFGLPALAAELADLAYRGGILGAADRIADLIPLIEGRGACRHPDGATQLAASALAAFRDDARMHELDGPCDGIRRLSLLPFPES